ncbi:hypothetical protein SPBR_03727 [Sporothrix brasiliensis 5110]|uniref:Stc1 domain-containing protein n=1 Tax=Sporothrix brasiliensis 5110 TaxID=1398154 RepID=A0A0C2JCS3_9PEZI|nr:uncharacterized protein SPBR_03727 [Sporothrix brasiliensis 5110]KIH94717.1 hypothetical protein SPBR_03727 [Sporothrix brasiliensis 5110]
MDIPRDAGPDGVVSLYLRPKNSTATQSTAGKIRCFAGGEWKPRSEFSNRQLEKFARARVPPGQSEISCRAHSTQIRRELKCEGPCAKWQPIENFSRSTRNHSKTLSVEPGFAPYVPPTALNEDDEDDQGDEDEDDHDGIIPIDEVPGERIEDWIQGNPSELGQFDRIEVGTQPSIVGSSSDISRPSLLDTRNRELGGLPEALSAVNLGRSADSGPSQSSRASIASASTVRGPAATALGGDLTPVGGSLLMGDSDTVSQSNRTYSNTLFSAANSRRASSQSGSVVSGSGGGGDTVWMENRFAALPLTPSQPMAPSQRAETRNGWARPVQRKTTLIAPRYVSNTGGIEIQPQKKTVYADADEDDSEDEC